MGKTSLRLQPFGLEKHSRPGFTGTPVVLQSFNQDPRLDPVHYMKAYVKRTKKCRTTESLFVILKRPHSKASTVTIARWISQVISQSEQKGTGGSVRSA